MAEAITQACSQCESPLLPGDTIGVWGQAVLDFNKKGRTIIRPLDSAEVLCEDCFEETNENLSSILDIFDEALKVREAKRGESEQVVEDPADAFCELDDCTICASGGCPDPCCESGVEYLDWGMTKDDFIAACLSLRLMGHVESAKSDDGCTAAGCAFAGSIKSAARPF